MVRIPLCTFLCCSVHSTVMSNAAIFIWTRVQIHVASCQLFLLQKHDFSNLFQVHGSVHQRRQQWIKTNQMHNSLKIIKTLLYSYSALYVSGTLAPIIRSLLILHIQPPVTVWLCSPIYFINSYNDQQKHYYFTNYHTPTCFDTIVSSSGIL
jgi:hypothetical protein